MIRITLFFYLLIQVSKGILLITAMGVCLLIMGVLTLYAIYKEWKDAQ